MTKTATDLVYLNILLFSIRCRLIFHELNSMVTSLTWNIGNFNCCLNFVIIITRLWHVMRIVIIIIIIITSLLENYIDSGWPSGINGMVEIFSLLHYLPKLKQNTRLCASIPSPFSSIFWLVLVLYIMISKFGSSPIWIGINSHCFPTCGSRVIK